MATITDLLHIFIDQYYTEVEDKPRIRVDVTKHLELVLEINVEYLSALKESKFGYEKHEGLFLERIEILTQVRKKMYDDIERRRVQKQRREAYFDSKRKPTPM